MSTRKMALWLLLSLAASGSALAQTVERKFMQVAPRAETRIVIDGKLDEPCWAVAPGCELSIKKHADCHRTVTRLVWDEKGIYAGVVCYQDNIDTLKAQIISRDGGAVWADDSSELFFSPRLSAINYYKFDVNSLGVFGDNYKEDAAQHHWEWNAVDAKCASGRVPGAWTIELFVSWKDMEFQAKEGMFIGFQQTRFEWNGAELRPSYLTGGGYYQVLLSFVYLSGPALPSNMELAQKMDKLIRKPWFVASDDKLWFFSDKKSLLAESPAKLIDMTAGKVTAAFDSLEKSIKPDTPAEMKQRLDDMRKTFAKQAEEKDLTQKLIAYSELIGKANSLAAALKMDAMLD